MLKQWIVFFVHSGNGYSKSGYPVLFTDSPPSPLSERRQTRISYEQWFPGLLLLQTKKFHKLYQTSCSRNTQKL